MFEGLKVGMLRKKRLRSPDKVRASRSWDFHATKKCPLPPHPGWFLAKSSELIEKKRVEFLLSAKEFARL